MSFQVIPAIDVRAGRVVRLAQGDYARETRFDADPFTLACDWAARGARWLHLVDLDAARAGRYSLQALLARLYAQGSLRVQTGGGVRSEAQVEELLGEGAARVVLGTVAARERDRVAGWLQRFGAERIVLALDVRNEAGGWRVQSEGWTSTGESPLDELLDFYSRQGARHVLCTDVSRDGMLGGFNLALYRELAERFPGLCLQASGGVRDLADLQAARDAGAGAAILGRALLEGRIDLGEAVSC
jgi:phosphoribosylformimino-5-aminoimidazole carboxamide ribotide isomerase